ncbi:MAG: hypothetical protein A9Z00_09375 [Thermobacillus sp. ZCTH02-B1]|uniref:YuiB family protein n=1 Tax=Thermobacillus sp. ZCTH02-B1 TaxID=1858795 RepID=UPI000B585EC5|nr:YuiB family protein [Thermobacillus sp. ZCTH02-B1]OUM97485.1 MAG: hypothetical protein A9Z00_09375 [Thermobacillus sp. ZCTH02-B1]
MLQLLVLVPLFFVLFFGIGFILNMLVKTTWMPVWLFVLIVIPFEVLRTWDRSESFAAHLTGYAWTDITVGLAGLVGAYASGWAIRKLRRSGYKMF